VAPVAGASAGLPGVHGQVSWNGAVFADEQAKIAEIPVLARLISRR
jgi:hypothetical protein